MSAVRTYFKVYVHYLVWYLLIRDTSNHTRSTDPSHMVFIYTDRYVKGLLGISNTHDQAVTVTPIIDGFMVVEKAKDIAAGATDVIALDNLGGTIEVALKCAVAPTTGYVLVLFVGTEG